MNHLPENIQKSALLGTLKQPFPVQDSDSSPEGQLLLEVCQMGLRADAGYVPGVDHLPLPTPIPEESTTRCNDNAMRYLRTIRSGTHQVVLKEWCIAAYRANLHVQEDVLPNLLRLGLKREELRPFILSVIGEKGLWLAAEITNQNWNWVLETPAYNLEDVIEYERLQEYEIIAQLESKKLDDLQPEFDRWSQYRLVWSPQLVEAFLASLERVKPSRFGGTWWIYRMRPFAYFFPIDMIPEIKQRIKSAPTFQPNDALSLKNMAIIWQFRQEMLDAINQEGTACL